MGSADPESAAQEAMKRSLAAAASRHAIEYYFADEPRIDTPEWSLLQLLGWLHGVLRFVVREERARARVRRERQATDLDTLDRRDPAPDQLASVIDGELRGIVRECLASLSAGYRSALLLRLDGVQYGEIATRLGINENTLATWLRRGAIELTRLTHDRIDGHGSDIGRTPVEKLRHA
jgi:DNA-directed RNA polymerase specialized sigma24 family protein